VIPDSYRSNFRPFYLQPPHALLSYCSLCSPEIGRESSALPFTGRFPFLASPHSRRLASASGRIEFIIFLIMDWSFASGCSPPRLSATQLPSATDRPVFLSDRDSHPTVGAYSQAHGYCPFRAADTNPSQSCDKHELHERSHSAIGITSPRSRTKFVLFVISVCALINATAS
jgi:hypothetical protein